MFQIIKSHNKKIEFIHSTTHSNKQCNCRDNEVYSVLRNRHQKNIVYRATIKTSCSVKQKRGVEERTIKQIIDNHKLSFTNRNYSTNTSLSTHIWRLKDMNISPTITFEILKLAPADNKISKTCLLCLHEKLAIITHPSQNTLLNKKIRNSIPMQTGEQTSTLTFRPIHITHPSYLYHFHY